MKFSEQMKDFLEQGAAKAQDWGTKGFQVSKDFVNKAGAKAQDLGERGVLMLEIKQLESQAEKLLASLGNEVYAILVEQGAHTVSAATPSLKPIIAEIGVVKEGIEKRKDALEARK
jgi:hypothetical protein